MARFFIDETGSPMMALDATDILLGELDPQNAPSARARRIIDSKIAELEKELETWKFVRDVLGHVKAGVIFDRVE